MLLEPYNSRGRHGEDQYDAIVVARVRRLSDGDAARPEGLQGARRRPATFPSDTLSTHIVHPPGVAALRRWGLLDRLTGTGCPPIDTYTFDFGPFTISGAPGTDDSPVAYCPRRTVLDKLLVDARVRGGRRGSRGVHRRGGRHRGRSRHRRARAQQGWPTVTEHAEVVIGADGRNSFVARAVRPEQYNEKPQTLCGYYTYWSGLPDGRPLRGVHPTGPGMGSGADARRPDTRRRRLAVRGVRGEQGTTSRATT